MKRVFCLLAAVALLLSLACCAKKENKPEPELNEVAQALLDGGVFAESLESVDRDVGETLYGVDATICEDAAFYMSSGAVADELAIFKAVDKDSAANIKTAIESRMDYQKNAFAGYIPAETAKFDSVQLRVNGETVVVCVCADAKAAGEILDKYF